MSRPHDPNSGLEVLDVRAFVPARNFEVSRGFYRALGWREKWSSADLSLLDLAGRRFMLQDRYVRAWAENCMLTVEVRDVDAWSDHVHRALDLGQFPDARIDSPRDEGWARVAHVWDPSGVLLHIAQFPAG